MSEDIILVNSEKIFSYINLDNLTSPERYDMIRSRIKKDTIKHCIRIIKLSKQDKEIDDYRENLIQQINLIPTSLQTFCDRIGLPISQETVSSICGNYEVTADWVQNIGRSKFMDDVFRIQCEIVLLLANFGIRIRKAYASLNYKKYNIALLSMITRRNELNDLFEAVIRDDRLNGEIRTNIQTMWDSIIAIFDHFNYKYAKVDLS